MLRVEGLQIETLQGTRILRDVTLNVSAGEILGLVGESGSGKTTLGLSMVGSLKPGLKMAGGRVSFGSRDIYTLESESLRQLRGASLVYIPQDARASLNSRLRIRRQLRLLFDKDDARYRHFSHLLQRVGLPALEELGSRYPHELSGGQLQRLTIATAFSSRPAVVVLDEPTTALDSITHHEVLNLIRDMLAEEGGIGIYVSHDISAVERLCDRIAVIYSGEVVEYGWTRQVLNSPSHPYTRGLVAAVPRIEGAPPQGIRGIAATPDKRLDGCAFLNRCPERTDLCPTDIPVPFRTLGERSVRCVHAGTVLAEVRVQAPLPSPMARPTAKILQTEKLEAAGIQVSFNNLVALKGIDVSIFAGEKVALLGESGSGKSTLARCLAGLHANFTGTLSYAHRTLPADVQDRSDRDRKEIQFIWQNPYSSLNPRRTVEQIVAQPAAKFFPGEASDNKYRVAAAIDAVGLSRDHLHRLPRQLSGGERQRVAIARAIICDPKILICDEITAALDVSVQASITSLLRDLAERRSMGFLFISHQLALVRHLVDRVYVLRNGSVIEEAAVDDIFLNPRQPYTQQLVCAASGQVSDN